MYRAFLYTSSLKKLERRVDSVCIDFLGGNPNLSAYDLTTFEYQYGRDVSHSIFCGVFLMGVNIYFSNNGFAFVFVAHFVDDRTYHTAGATPGCPEVYHNGLITFQYYFFECSIGYF